MEALIEAAARVFCEDALTDYRRALDKAARQLGLAVRDARVNPVDVEAAVIRYQRMFGGEAYAARLADLRQTAIDAMGLLAEFEPRLVGAAVSGAITESHRVQLHAFADKPESVDLLLEARRIPFSVSERHYRYADGREAEVPVLSFGDDERGVDVAVFPERERRRAPLSAVTGVAAKRLARDEVEALAGGASPRSKAASA